MPETPVQLVRGGAGGEGRVARSALAGVADRLEAAVKAGPFAVHGARVQRVPLVATIQ